MKKQPLTINKTKIEDYKIKFGRFHLLVNISIDEFTVGNGSFGCHIHGREATQHEPPHIEDIEISFSKYRFYNCLGNEVIPVNGHSIDVDGVKEDLLENYFELIEDPDFEG